MRYKNKELIENWQKAANMPKVLSLFKHVEITKEKNLQDCFNNCDIVLITGEPTKCKVAQRGPLKGLQVFTSPANHQMYTILQLTLETVGSSFKDFLRDIVGDFFYPNGVESELSDLTFNVAKIASANYASIKDYRKIKSPELKKFIGNDRDIQSVMQAIYINSMSVDWSVPPVEDASAVGRISTDNIAKQTKIPVKKVQNVVKILRFIRAISEVSVAGMTPSYRQRYINPDKVYAHTPIYTLFPLNSVDWSIAIDCGFTGKTRLTQSAITYFYGEEIAAKVFPDKKDATMGLPVMQTFGKILNTHPNISLETLLNTAKSLIDTDFDTDLPLRTIKGIWQSFKVFLPLINLQILTASEAAKQGIEVSLAAGREKVLIPA